MVELLHRVIGRSLHGRTEEEPLDVVSSIKVDRQASNLGRSEGSARYLVVHAIYAVATVVDTLIAKKNFEQGDAATVLRPRVTYSAFLGISQSS